MMIDGLNRALAKTAKAKIEQDVDEIIEILYEEQESKISKKYITSPKI